MAKPEEVARQLWLHTLIRQAHFARHEAQTLLPKAKRAVEVAIEKGEEKALFFLKAPQAFRVNSV